MSPFSPNRFFILRLVTLVSLLSSAGLCGATQSALLTASAAPHVVKIEPPNWWIGLPDPMLMITGEHLAGAMVSSNTPGVRVVRSLDGLKGHYLFVWLEISPATSSENVKLDISVSNVHQEILFPLADRDPSGLSPSAGSGFNGFSADDVIYLIMPDRFDDGDSGNNFPSSGAYDRKAPRAYHGGDLRGIAQRLPYLKELGVTTIWITPIYQNDDRAGRDYHGYGATDLYAVEKHLGTLDDYRSLVQTARELGLKVLLDIVPNHVGPTNPWVDDPPTDRWFHGTRDHHFSMVTPFQLEADPHAGRELWRDVVEGWFANILPDMGTDDAVTAQYLRQNALWWAETGALDGFRLDTFPYVDRQFWHDFHAEVHRTYPRFRTVGEVFNPDPTVTSYFVGGKTSEGIDSGVDTVFDFPLAFAIRDVTLHDAPAKQLEEVLRHDWMFPHPETLVTFLGNHDMKRFMGEPGATAQKLKLAFSLLLTMRGIPQIYYADEIGMPGGEDPDNRHDFPGGFPGDSHDAFTAEGRTPAEQEVFAHVQTLLHMRQTHAALRCGKMFYLYSDDQTYAFLRESARNPNATKNESPEQLLMVMNNAAQLRTIELNLKDSPIAGAQSIAPLMGSGEVELVKGLQIKVSLPPRSLNIYRVE
jgi:neopullulanase